MYLCEQKIKNENISQPLPEYDKEFAPITITCISARAIYRWTTLLNFVLLPY